MSREVMDTLALVLTELGELDRASELLQRAARAEDADPEVEAHLAQALARRGEQEEAREILLRLLAEPGALAERDRRTPRLAPGSRRLTIDPGAGFAGWGRSSYSSRLLPQELWPVPMRLPRFQDRSLLPASAAGCCWASRYRPSAGSGRPLGAAARCAERTRVCGRRSPAGAGEREAAQDRRLQALIARAEAGDPVAQNALGEKLENGEGVQQDFAAAARWYRLAAAQGLPRPP